jgi:ATP-dependent helicase IRC3
MELRGYQTEAIQAFYGAVRRGVNRSMIGLPTGTGKTVIFGTIAHQLRDRDRRVLILAHRDELLEQARDKLCQINPDVCGDVGFVRAAEDDWATPITIASVQTLCRKRRYRRVLDGHAAGDQADLLTRSWAEHDAGDQLLRQAQLLRKRAKKLGATTPEGQELRAMADQRQDDAAEMHDRAEEMREQAGVYPWDLVIVDEAHHTAADSYQTIIRKLGGFDPNGPRVLGVTATPQRADSLNLGDTYDELIYHRDMLSMIQEGYLVDLRGIQIRLQEFKVEDLKVRAGDYVAEEAASALEAAEAPAHIVGAWKEHASDRKTLIFTPTVALAESIKDKFLEAGVQAENISAVADLGMDARREALQRFHRGETRVMTNALLLTEGFDEPTVDCIVIARPTRSQPLYVQMVGRGTRISPGKKDCLVMDMVGVTDRMDLTTLPKLFGLDPNAVDDRTAELVEEEGVVAALSDQQAREARAGKIVAKRVGLFQRAALAWSRVADGLWALSMGEEMLTLEADDDGRWSVYVKARAGQKRRIADNLDQGYAMGTAEEYARKVKATNLVSKDAAWRTAPATEQQLRTLRRFRKPTPDGMTKGEASDMITSAIAEFNARAGR